MQRSLLLILVGVSYLLFGGAVRWTLGVLLVLTLITVLVAPRRVLWFPRSWRVLDLSLAALLGGLILQVIPLPRVVVGLVSPFASRLQTSLELPALGQGPSGWRTLSIDPTATLDALATMVLGVFAFWIARGVFSAGGSTRQFCRWLALLGVAAAISAVILRVLAPGTVLGILDPVARSATPFGAFVNRNHFAGWLLMVATPVWGYLIAHLRIHPSYRERWVIRFRVFMSSGAFLTALAATAIVGVLLLTLSRSAAAGLGAAALSGWYVGRSRLRIERTTLPSVLAAAGVALLMVVLFVDIEGWSTRFEQSLRAPSGDRDRITIWMETVPVVRDFWATGTGAGTFAEAMMRYQQSRIWIGAMGKWALFNNAHSHYLQVVAEGGLLLALPAAAALLSLLQLGRRAINADRGEMFWARVGAGAGLVGMAVQSIWETSLIMPANAILCGALAALLIYQRRGSANEPSTDSLPLTAPAPGLR